MNVNRVAALVSTTAVGIVVIAGFLLIGTPTEQRLERLDDRRLHHLQELAHAVDGYWEDHASLPATLADLVDGRRLSRLPLDPVSGEPYDYETTTEEAYRLCAGFDRATEETRPQTFWSHQAGRECYDFDVTAGPAPMP